MLYWKHWKTTGTALETAPFFCIIRPEFLPAQLGRVGQAQTVVGRIADKNLYRLS
jgi:hypothetical protein